MSRLKINPVIDEQIAQSLAEKEYESLRQELSDSVAETRALERNAVLASAAIWTWLLVQPAGKPWVGFATFIPFTLCLFASVRSWALYRDIRQHADYLLGIEKKWGEAKVISWEHYLHPQKKYLGLTAVIIWIALTFGNFGIAWCMKQNWFTPETAPASENSGAR